MKQATFINLKALSSTRAVKFAQRARAAADSARSALQASKKTSSSAPSALELDASKLPSPERLAEQPKTPSQLFEGQIYLTLVDEGRKFFWPAELLQCPRCGVKPALEADWDPASKKPRYRVAPNAMSNRSIPPLCDQPIGDWHASNRDAIRCWNLAVRLAQ